MNRRPPRSTLFPYTTLSRSARRQLHPRQLAVDVVEELEGAPVDAVVGQPHRRDDPQGVEVCVAAPTELGEQLGNRSEEHTSELQSRQYLVCRLLLEKKKNIL